MYGSTGMKNAKHSEKWALDRHRSFVQTKERLLQCCGDGSLALLASALLASIEIQGIHKSFQNRHMILLRTAQSLGGIVQMLIE